MTGEENGGESYDQRVGTLDKGDTGNGRPFERVGVEGGVGVWGGDRDRKVIVGPGTKGVREPQGSRNAQETEGG